MAAWRYWRIYITADSGGGGADISDITMEIAGVDQTDPVTAATAATAESRFDATLAAQYAFDASLSTRWASDFTGYPTWIQYDFGPGNDKALDKVTIRIFSAANRGPRDFRIQASADGVDWLNADVQTGVVWVSATERKEFAFTSPDPTPSDQRVSALTTQVLVEESGMLQVSQMATLVLWGIESTARASQVTAQILGRAPVRRTIGITD